MLRGHLSVIGIIYLQLVCPHLFSHCFVCKTLYLLLFVLCGPVGVVSF